MKRAIVISESYTRLETESLRKYLKEVSRIPVFETPEAEAECGVRAASGDKDAIDELARRNLRFVVSVAKKFQNTNATLEDLINQGNIGLYEAAKRYDPTTGNKFISYAVWWIRKEIMDYLNNNTRMIRLPLNKVGQLNKFKREVEKLTQTEGKEVSKYDMYDNLEGFSDCDIDDIFRVQESLTESYDISIGFEDSNVNVINTIESNEDSTDHMLVDSDNKFILTNLFTKLNDSQKKVITMFFGLTEGKEPMNLNEVGYEMGVTRERVRQIKDKGLRVLRANATKLGLNDFPF